MRRYRVGAYFLALFLVLGAALPLHAQETTSALNLDEGRLVEALDRAPSDPTLLSRLARKARQEGRLVDAAWFADHALELEPGHALAQEEGRILGWDVADAEETSPLPLEPAWPWWLGAGLALLLLGGSAWRSGDQLALSALFVGTLTAALVMPPTALVRPSLLEPLERLSEGAPCPTRPMTWRAGELRVATQCGEREREIVVAPTRAGQLAITHTLRHSITYLGQGGSQDLQLMVAHVASAMAAAEAQGYTIPGPVVKTPTRFERWQGADPALRAQLRISAGVVAATIWILLALLVQLILWLRRHGLEPGLRLPLALAAVGIFFAPEMMRMVYGGYDLTHHLVEGVIPRYGPGALWFYGPTQWLFEADHAHIQALNRLYGLGVVFALVALTRRWFPDRRAAQALVWLVATLPIFYAGISCESIHVGPSLGILAGLWLAASPHKGQRVAALLPWLAASMTRPEMAVMALFAPLLILAMRPKAERALGRDALPVVLGGLVMMALIFREVLQTSESMASQSALELGFSSLWGKALTAGLFQSVFTLPQATPTVLLGLLIAGVAFEPIRARAWPLLLFALMWMGLTGVDYAPVSLPRIHFFPLVLCLPLAAAMVPQLLSSSRLLLALLGLLYLGGAIVSASHLFAPNNEVYEEALWREALTHVPDEGPLCIAALGYGDAPEAGLSPRHNPSYLVEARGEGRVVRHLGAIDELTQSCAGPVYALLGTRCHVAMREEGEAAPGPQGLSVCREVRARGDLEVIIEREVPNHGDIAYPMYPRAERLPIAFYRVGTR